MTVHPTVPEILGDRDGSTDPWLEWTCEQGGVVWVVCVCVYVVHMSVISSSMNVTLACG